MRVTVEGVETPQQVDFLTATNADLVQGFYFGRPVPVSELAPLLLRSVQKGFDVAAKPKSEVA